MQIATYICAAKDIGPTVGTAIVGFSTLLFRYRQQQRTNEQLRNQHSVPRKVVYDIFDELLLALGDKKSDDEIRSLYWKADSARRDVSFLFDNNPKIKSILGQICNAVKLEVIDNKEDLVKTRADILYEKNNLKLRKIIQHEEAKVKICNDFRAPLREQFLPLLKLTNSYMR